jgi:hypothetical protein
MVSKNGQMVLSMKEIGKTIELMERENSFILMEISMMVNGLMIKLMDSESTTI